MTAGARRPVQERGATRATNRGAPLRTAPRRPGARRRRIQRALSLVLIVAGGLLVADAGVTVAWQEPITAYFTQRTQDRLGVDLARLASLAPTPREKVRLATFVDDRQRIAYLAGRLRRRAHAGQAVGHIRIPRIGAAYVVVKGSSPGPLRKGPGVYDGVAFPGEGSTTAVAGHRTTYLAPFRHIDDLRRGDHITLTMPYATLTYAVEGTRIVDPGDVSVLRDIGRERLVLSACHPLFSASQRIVVFARLVRERPGIVLRRLASGLKAGPPRGR